MPAKKTKVIQRYIDEKPRTDQTHLVSIIIPFYNRIDLVVESVESALNQTYRNIEVLLVDDGSTESTEAIAQLAKENSKITLLQAAHCGVSEARNLALKKAKGDYIAFLDSDDLFVPEKIEIQLNYMLSNNIDFSHTSYEKIDMRGNKLGIAHSGLFSGDVYPAIIGGCPLATPTIMAKKYIFVEENNWFKKDFQCGEDVCLWIDIASKHPFGAIDIPLSCVRISLDSAAYNSEKQLTGLNNIYSYCSKHSLHRIYREQLKGLQELMAGCKMEIEKKRTFEQLYQKNQLKKEELAKEFKKDGFMPLVSVVIPVYNGSNYLAEAIDSVLLQTYPNIEILVINDGSKDGGATETIAKRYGNKIHYIAKQNGGVASALNLGIQKMKGDYFSWLSHDDLYLPDKVESQVRLLLKESDKHRIICGGYTLFHAENGEDFGTMNPIPAYGDKLSIPLYPVFRGVLNGCTMLIHKSHFERVGLFDEALPTTQDYDLWFRMLRGQSVLFQKDIHVRSRCHAEQGSRTLAHKNEARDLWIHMMDAVTDAECVQISGCKWRFYHELYKFLKENLPQNYGAWGHARKKAIEVFTEEYKRGKYDTETFRDIMAPCGNEALRIFEDACRDECKQKCAIVAYGSITETEKHLLDKIQQLNPTRSFYYINIVMDGKKVEEDRSNHCYYLNKEAMTNDSIASLLIAMHAKSAVIFYASTNIPDEPLSICAIPYILVHGLNENALSSMPLQAMEDAWAIIGLDSSTEFLDSYVISNHLTYSDKVDYQLIHLLQDMDTTPSIEAVQWYQNLIAARKHGRADSMEELCQFMYGTTVQTAYANTDELRNALEQIRLMENTLSWKITKPLRTIRKYQLALKRRVRN